MLLLQMAVKVEVLVTVLKVVTVVVVKLKPKRTLSKPSGALKPDWILKGMISSGFLAVVALLIGFNSSLADLLMHKYISIFIDFHIIMGLTA